MFYFFADILRYMSAKIGVVTFVRGTIVQRDLCPRRQMSKGQLSKETFVQGRVISMLKLILPSLSGLR